MRKSRRAIACLVAFLQAWVPVAFEFQGTLAVADAVVQNAGEGQTLGSSVLRGQFGVVRNTTLTNQHVDANTASNFSSSGGQLNLQEFGLGGDITAAKQRLKEAYDNPDTLNDVAKQAKRDIQERGCPSTTFEFVRSGTVLTVRPIKITLTEGSNGAVARTESVDTTYVGEVRVSYPSIGYTRTFDQVIAAPQVGTPGVSLRYTATPFTVPNDGSFFTYNHRISGSSGTPVVTDFGKKDNGYATTSLVYISPGGAVTVTADLYRVKRVYSPQPITGCPADPPSCIVSGLNFCGPPGLGVLDVFQSSKNHKNAAMGALMDAASAVEYTESDANMTPIVSRGVQTLNGGDPVFSEIFSGCSETANFTTNTVTVHQENIQTCSMPLVDLPYTCSGTRGTRFVYLQESTVLTATFYQRVKVPIINPETGEQAKDAEGNLLYTEQDKPAMYSGAVDINVPTFGGFRSWSSSPDGNGYFIKYELTPFSVSANEYFPYDITAQSDGGVSAAVSSLGGKSNNWTLSGSASVSDAAQMRLNAKLYQVMNNNLVGCEDYLKHAADGFCAAQMQCTENRGPCTTLDGVSFCDGSGVAAGVAELLKPWGVEDSAQAGGNLGNGVIGGGAKEFLPRMCWAATGNKMDCSNSITGQMNCYTDLNGVQRCGTIDTSNLATNFGEGPTHKDDCAAPGIELFGNPACKLVSTNACTEGAAGLFSGTCYNKTVIYDCGEDKQITVPGGVSYSQSCGSPIRCMGTECHNPKGEVNRDFGKAVASANITDMAARDMICAETGEKPTSVGQACTPLIFNGEKRTCKIPIGNSIGLTPNCCKESEKAAAEAPDAISYVQLVMLTYKMGNDKMMLSALARLPGLSGFSQSLYSNGGAVQSAIDGAIANTQNFLMDSASTVAKTFGYEFSSPAATATTKDFVLDPSNVGLSPTQMAGFNDFLRNNGMGDLADMLFTFDGTEGIVQLSPMGEQMFAALEYVQTVFMIYSIAKIIGHIIFKCEKSELELGIQKKQRNCHYVGNYCAMRVKFVGCIEKRESYCCYKTPLSRIVAEQIRTKAPQVAGGYGEPSGPQCGGFTPAQLSAFDWSLFDPGEWILLLQEAGLIPDSTTSAETMWGLNSSRAVAATGSTAQNGEIDIQTQTIQRYTPLVETYIQRRDSLSRESVCFSDPNKMAWYKPKEMEERFFELDRDVGAEVPVWSAKTFDIQIDVEGTPKEFALTYYRADNYGQLWVNGNLVYQNTLYSNIDMRNGNVSSGYFYDQNGSLIGEFYDDGCNSGCMGVSPNIDITSYLTSGVNTLTLVCANANSIGPCRIKIMGSSEEPPVQTTGCISPSGAESPE